MPPITVRTAVMFALCTLVVGLPAQTPKPPDMAAAANGLTLRSIGPAIMGGRVADVEVHPKDRSTWYVAVGSGGVWKTTNAGTTFAPVFDAQPSYSIGEITIASASPEIVWVGTGENVSGRHVGWGDGVYRSRDAGSTWERVGLQNSQHIGRILVDPRNSDVVLVAAEGPLWSAGGDRGVYRSADGGATWSPVLQIDEHTGVTDLEFDPANPDIVYAAGYQRRRHVWGFLAGGPGSGIWKSSDNGKTWRKVTTGLPKGDMGKIGLAVTAADPSVVYATIEAAGEERGFYRSRDKGESWSRRNGYISGGTGPHYYQEIEASPTQPDLVYQMDVFLHVTRDGGGTLSQLETAHDKHSDNHALWIDPIEGRHLIVGTDGGLYESFDEGRSWRHFPNLPIAQFYKVALNNREPFYDVLGGAQDLGTLHGPARTMNRDGIRNQDWYVPMGADGYGVAFDPRDPNLMYLMWQEGNLFRKDRRNEEAISIKPQAAPGDPPERWNWDSPILVSPHNPDRIYFGSQRLWRSDSRGDDWTPISGDLTLGQNRYEQKFVGRLWSVDALHDTAAMSKYATTTTIAESPLQANVLFVGTDDGLVQVSPDGGKNWTRTSALPGLPPLSFVNDVEASLHDARTIYAVADAHKIGDFSPYVYASTDLGKSWRSIAGDLPKGTIVWALQQDHVQRDLLFLGTEFGIYWTPNAGRNWHKLTGGVPTIPFRDVKIHRRDNDLVGASFGRGFYVVDDYSPLRAMAGGALTDDTALFPVRDAWWYVPYQVAQANGRPELGTDDFTAPNPPFGALLTYFLREAPSTAKEARQAEEKKLRDKAADVPFPGFDRLAAEAIEAGPKAIIVISDATGRTVRWIDAPARAGLQRVNWDLRGPSPEPVSLEPPGVLPPWVEPAKGALVAPGRYSAALMIVSGSGVRTLGKPQGFEVKPVNNLPQGTDIAAVVAFQQEVVDLRRRAAGVNEEINRARDQLRRMRAALVAAPKAEPALFARFDAADQALAVLTRRLQGAPRADGSTSPMWRRSTAVCPRRWLRSTRGIGQPQRSGAMSRSRLPNWRRCPVIWTRSSPAIWRSCEPHSKRRVRRGRRGAEDRRATGDGRLATGDGLPADQVLVVAGLDQRLERGPHVVGNVLRDLVALRRIHADTVQVSDHDADDVIRRERAVRGGSAHHRGCSRCVGVACLACTAQFAARRSSRCLIGGVMQWFLLYTLAATLEQAPNVHDWRTSGANPCACTDSMPFIIGELPPVDTAVRVEALVRDASSLSCRTARLAVEALRDAAAHANATDALVTALSADACAVRASAAWSLMKHPRSRATGERLIALLHDPDRRVQQAAASALAIHGDEDAIDGLMELLTHSSKHVRQAAVTTLGRLRAGGAAAALTILARKDPERHVREAAQEALRQIQH